MFPLHLNTFNTLFSDAINPKLSELTKNVSEFICLTTEIDSFKCSLNGVSTYLNNVNPAHESIKLVETFDGNTYLIPVRSDIVKIIENLNGKMKYEEIIKHLYSLARLYNQRLKSKFETFKNKIAEHKTSLEENIEKYIEKIKEDLTEHSSCVQEFIQLVEKIKSQIENFSQNYSQIHKSRNYLIPKNLMKKSQPGSENHRVSSEDFSLIYKISNSILNYRNDSRIFNSHKIRLFNYINLLKSYSNDISKIETNNSGEFKNYMSSVHHILGKLEDFKAYVDEFVKHMDCVKKLEKIDEYIKTMKSKMDLVKGKVLPQVESYIQGLKDIDIKANEVETSIKTIKSVNNIIIGKLQIAKHTIDFYQTLQKELDNLNGVKIHECYYHNNIEYLEREFSIVKSHVASFESGIKSKTNVLEEIKEIKEKIEEGTTTEVTCDDKKQEEEDDNDPISKVETCIDSSLKDIKSFIYNSFNDINVIKYLLPLLENNKNQSETYLSSIKSKVCAIKELKDAPTKLSEARDQLNKFLQFQQITKFLIDKFRKYHWKFGSIGRYSNELDDIISDSNNGISLINYYIDYLTTVGYVDNLVKWINSCYSSRFREIKGIINKFNPNVKQVSFRLGIINYNLCLIKTLSCRTSVENNLWRLKDYMMNLKVYLDNVKTDLTNLKVIMNKIKEDISKINRYKCVLERLEKIVGEYIKWFGRWTSNKLMVNYLKSINDKINEIIIVRHLMVKSSSITRIEKIKSKLNSVESKVSELECAIERVARNFIQCSILSTINGTFTLINYSNKNKYNIYKDINVCNIDIGNHNVLFKNDDTRHVCN